MPVRQHRRIPCANSLRERSSAVSGLGIPPAAETTCKGPRPPKRILLSDVQNPPRTVRASQIVCAGPPDASIRLSFPPLANARYRLSGDQTGARDASSVLAIGWASSVSRDRTQIMDLRSAPVTTKAVLRPSGETARSRFNEALAGAEISKRTISRTAGFLPKWIKASAASATSASAARSHEDPTEPRP